MPISFEEAQNHHPLELTRFVSPEVPMAEGDFTLAQLQEKFSMSEASEEDVLAAAGNAGMAFFKVGGIYKSFVPKLGEDVEAIATSPSLASGVEVSNYEEEDDEDEDDEDEELDSDNLDDETAIATMFDDVDDDEWHTGSGEDDPGDEDQQHIGSDEHDSSDRTHQTESEPTARVGTLYEPNDNPDGVIF